MNAMYNEKRRAKRMRRLDKNLAGPAPVAHVSTGVEAARLLERCSGLDKSLIFQQYARGHAADEIAKIHGISAVAVRVRIHRAKMALRKYASKRNGRR